VVSFPSRMLPILFDRAEKRLGFFVFFYGNLLKKQSPVKKQEQENKNNQNPGNWRHSCFPV
jgi:hypothetical protein